MDVSEKLLDWQLEECSRLDGLRQAGDQLREVFAKARDGNERYRILLDFASRQDNTPDAEPNEEEMPCVAEEGAPPLFRVCCEELEQAGLLQVRRKEAFYRFPDMSKTGIAIFILGLTYKGRMELARLERERREASWWHRIKACLWTAICFTAGALVSAFIGWLFR